MKRVVILIVSQSLCSAYNPQDVSKYRSTPASRVWYKQQNNAISLEREETIVMEILWSPESWVHSPVFNRITRQTWHGEGSCNRSNWNFGRNCLAAWSYQCWVLSGHVAYVANVGLGVATPSVCPKPPQTLWWPDNCPEGCAVQRERSIYPSVNLELLQNGKRTEDLWNSSQSGLILAILFCRTEWPLQRNCNGWTGW